MKKLLFILFAAVTIVGCTKDANANDDVDVDSISTPENFTVADLTRAVDQKTSWAVNDQIAIFESSDRVNAKCYYVADLSSRELKPLYESDQFYAISTNEYIGFYPYVAGQSYADYKAATTKNFSDTDIIWSGGGEFKASADLAFTHSQSYLSFEFKAGSDLTDGFDSLAATLYIGDDKCDLDIVIAENKETATASVFVAPLNNADFSQTSKMLHIVARSGDMPIFNIVDLANATNIDSWDASTPYEYSDLTIGGDE